MWLSRLPADMPAAGRSHIGSMFDQTIDHGLLFLHKHAAHLVLPVPDLNVISCLCHLLLGYLNFMAAHGGFGKPGT
jgi:hypothetical protein